MDKKHELLADLKRVAFELGRMPSRQDYLSHSEFGKRFESVFGTWTIFRQAAGLEEPKKDQPKFHPIEETLAKSREPFTNHELSIPYPWVIVGDLHFPFTDLNALTLAYGLIERIKPNLILQIGDLKDNFAQSKFPRTHNTYNPTEEAVLGHKMAEDFWESSRNASPTAQCIQILGNHDLRALKRVIEKAPELEHMIDFYKWFTFDGVQLVKDAREVIRINDVAFTHGHLSQLGAHRDMLQSNVVVGHSHLGGVSYRHVNGKTLWELNCGYLGDPMSKALSYTPTKSVKWTHGIGVVDEYGPRFIPF